MKKIIYTISFIAITMNQINAQNSFNAIKTSQRGGILTTLVNPADLAGMPQKFDLNIVGFDMNVANNIVNFTSSELGQTSDFKDRFFNRATPEGLNVRINADIVGPSLAIALNKKTAVGIITRARMNMALNNIDIITGKAIVDGTYSSGTSLPYTTPRINNMSANLNGWGELGAVISTEIFKDARHSVKIGGTVKGIFAGSYANVYMSNFKMTFDTVAGNLQLKNGSGNLGLEYSGNSDPLKSVSDNLFGAPTGLGIDAGISYQYKNITTGKYIVKLGASLIDLGSMRVSLDKNNSRQFVINSSATIDPKKINGKDLDAIIANIKNTGAVSEQTSDTSITLNLPMALNLQADVNVWKSFFVTLNLQRRATDELNPRSMKALNYFTVTPRMATRFIELYMPFTFAEVQGTTIGAGFKLGPLYVGSSSLISAMMSKENKAIDFHFGIRAGFGKRFK
jgi:Family of unknown function (DUF5723)